MKVNSQTETLSAELATHQAQIQTLQATYAELVVSKQLLQDENDEKQKQMQSEIITRTMSEQQVEQLETDLVELENKLRRAEDKAAQLDTEHEEGEAAHKVRARLIRTDLQLNVSVLQISADKLNLEREGDAEEVSQLAGGINEGADTGVLGRFVSCNSCLLRWRQRSRNSNLKLTETVKRR